ncbi:hypothetical protein [Sulfurospirillum arcachonense]|uniref:hypothetical protein n=1 Tax=Sulfurospirillum arcachonense TaxID=57666 RepID=UPI000469F08D|nr:hypothetical protein [Sulfurospirillum arcachonense]
MKKIILFLLCYPIFLFSGVFEHLINKDKTYLFEHNFRCNNSICISSEKNIFDNAVMDHSVKVIKTFLDHNDKVFKIEIELSIYNEKREAFYDAILRTASKKERFKYSSYMVNDKYGNHPFIDIIDTTMEKKYISHLSDIFYKTMTSYKN